MIPVLMFALLAQATTQVVTVKGMSTDELLVRVGIYGAVGAAVIIGLFKLVDLIMERIGNSKKLWRELFGQQAQIKTLAKGTEQLIDVNTKNPSTDDVNPAVANEISEIASAPPSINNPSK